MVKNLLLKHKKNLLYFVKVPIVIETNTNYCPTYLLCL